MAENQYSEENIQVITMQEAILKRPGMFLGYPDQRGFISMIANVISDLLEKHAGEIGFEIEFHHYNQIIITIRNIDFQRFKKYIETNDTYGFPLLITTSRPVTIRIEFLREVVIMTGNKGILTQASSVSTQKEEKAIIDLTPDSDIFKDLEISYELVNETLRRFALLNPRLKITSIEYRELQQRNIFHYPRGIFQEMDFELGKRRHTEVVFRHEFEATVGERNYRICITYLNAWPDNSIIRTYANNIELNRGGSLEHGILNGIVNALKAVYAGKTISYRHLAEKNLFLLASVSSDRPLHHKGSYLGILDESLVRKETCQLVSEKLQAYLSEHPDISEFLS